MAKVYNDTRFTLTCTQIRKSIRPHGFVMVSDEQAKLVKQNGQFRVVNDEQEQTTKRTAPVAEPPVRKRATRGGKQVEQSAPPKTEKRDDTVWFTDSPNKE